MLLKNFTLDIRCDGRQLVSVDVLKAQATRATLRVRGLRGAAHAHCPAAVASAVRFEEELAQRTCMVRCFDSLDADAVEAHALKHGHAATYRLLCSGEFEALKGSS